MIKMALGKMMALAGAAAVGVALFRRHRGSERESSPFDEVRGSGGEGGDIRDAGEFADPVDQAIDESFPASDPPAYAGHRQNSEDV